MSLRDPNRYIMAMMASPTGALRARKQWTRAMAAQQGPLAPLALLLLLLFVVRVASGACGRRAPRVSATDPPFARGGADGCVPPSGGSYAANMPNLPVTGMGGAGCTIRLTSFRVQDHEDCSLDRLTINGAAFCGTYSGFSRYPPLDTPFELSSTPTFTSDGDRQRAGFCWVGPYDCPGAWCARAAGRCALDRARVCCRSAHGDVLLTPAPSSHVRRWVARRRRDRRGLRRLVRRHRRLLLQRRVGRGGEGRRLRRLVRHRRLLPSIGALV